MALIADVALAGALLLVVAGVRHLRHGIGVITSHALLPGWLARQGSRVEPVVGLSLAAAWLSGAHPAVRAAGALAAVWHLLLVGYLVVVWRTRGRVPCGCLDDTSRVSGVKVGMGLLWAMASAALAAGLAPPPADLVPRSAHLLPAAFVAGLAVVAGLVVDLLGTSRAPQEYMHRKGDT
ncbi:MauE/DoxX family redox-associated membrane protein [Nonomuraea turcica]|uniref:MauE/DoxX family redox-associated membrane protein n=1 Tax=Nonomuraea sp. G32 TaxID=3067274 RepID=UPI00273A933C|nr:MauE/DoxX family redox-associated membrane protein [Nonomuraea sp. G32]MDP4504818.1 MauE/DoxX family redox-associated membrane protein [Nonomuraea sp. G32]